MKAIISQFLQKRRDAYEPKEHDYTRRYWGHNVELLKKLDESGHEWRAMGFGSDVHAQDFLILKNGEGTTRYQIVTIEHMRDPEDQWFARIKFAPRHASQAEGEGEDLTRKEKRGNE